MGKSGYLPDISHNFGFFRTLAVNSVQKSDWIGASSALYNLNGCLGEDYLVTISTEKFLEIMGDKSVYQCNHCTMKIKKKVNEGEEDEKTIDVDVPMEVATFKVKIFDMIIPLIHSVLSGSETAKVWVCPECEKINEISETTLVRPQMEKPYCIRVVWDCPKKSSGLTNRLGFSETFGSWFWNFLEEINWQEVLYRKEYITQNEGEDMAAYKDKGDIVQ